MVLRVFPISHEPNGELAVKHVVIYDAVVRLQSYPSHATNKEEAFLYMH